MSKRPVKRRPKPWPIVKLYGECRAAPVVWLTLCDMAADRGSPVVTPTREQIAQATGIKKLATVSAGLTALHKAAWLDREHVPITQAGRQVATMLRLVLRRVAGAHSRSARKTASTAQTSVAPEKRLIARGRKMGADFPKGKGARTAPPLPANAGVSGAAPADAQNEHPSTRIERERLVAIRRKRVASDTPDTDGDASPDYLPSERVLLADAPDELRATVDRVKAALQPLGGGTSPT